MNKRHMKWPEKFGILYGIALLTFTVYVLLDTFVIPRGITAVSSAQQEADSGEDGNLSAKQDAENRSADAELTEAPSETSQGSAEEANVPADTADGSAEAANIAADTADGSAEAAGAPSETADVLTPVITDTSYDDGQISISIDTQRVSDTTCYIVDVRISDLSGLRSAFARDTYGRNIKERTSDMAAEHNAILAINGDYYGFRDYGYVLRNGTLYRDRSGNEEDLVIDSDGSMRIIREDEISADELAQEGVWQVFSFGPALVNNGEVVVGANQEVEQAMTSNPRTAIGMISPLHYLIVVSDGRTRESAGLTLAQLGQVFADHGAFVAYNLDGGGSSTLYFNGKVINHPTGGAGGSSERRVSDIIYFA